MAVSTFLVVIIGTIITDKIIEPKLGKYTPSEIEENKNEVTSIEKKDYFGQIFLS